MKKLLSLLFLMLFASTLSIAQSANNISYNWNNVAFSADGAQAKRHIIGRVYFNEIAWGDYASIKLTLRQKYYTSGTAEYLVVIKQGAPAIYCTSALGQNIDKVRITLGAATSAGNSYDGYNNAYQDIYLDLDYYTQVVVEAHIVGGAFAWDKTTLTVPSDFQFCTLFTTPSSQNISTFYYIEPKNVVLTDNHLNNYNLGIGTLAPQGKVHIYKTTTGDGEGSVIIDGPTNSERSIIFNDAGTPAWWFGRDNTNSAGLNDGIGFWKSGVGTALVIKDDGRICVGCTTPQTDSKLSVNGAVFATKVKVTTSGWADFVFDDHYKTPTLAELEAYIREHRHLPEIPSAKDVATEGIDLGEMNKKLLQKVEELTLYIIEQNKRIEALEKAK